jgi:hypothetical protein
MWALLVPTWQEERVVQEDIREVVLVVPVDPRVEQVGIIHPFVPIYIQGGFLDLYILSSRGDNSWDNQGKH